MSRYALADVLAKTEHFFDLAEGIPVLRAGLITCGCGNATWVPRFWKWHIRPDSTTGPHRCDVAVKCSDCAQLAKHGALISAEWWDARPCPADQQINHHDLNPAQQAAVAKAAQ